jgi:transcriptional regulator with XRE-family HTH domain
MITLGEAIRKLRKAGGLSQRELSERVRVDPTYVSHLESNRREPSLTLLKQISSELGVPPGVLLAVALWTELPTADQEAYKPVIDRLLQMAGKPQMDLLASETP